jgi:serine protease
MKNYKILLLLIFAFHVITAQPVADKLEKSVILKVKDQYRNGCNESGISIPVLTSYFNKIGVIAVSKKFPGKQKPSSEKSKDGHKLIDLSLIYEVKYSKDIPLEKVLTDLVKTGYLVYAEPHYIPALLFSPDDPGAVRSIQYYLTRIHAYEAWDINKGDTNTVIGITDTGTDLAHPDLSGTVKHNYMDPIDGLDNDLDGYRDNFNGWDLGSNDNNPNWEALAHGVHVTGLASAQTNNGIGMAGTGYNCRYLPVKISNSFGSLVSAYEGIVYAADHGCQVINCSWGSTGGGQFGQDIVDYAVFNRDALVISASGNDNKLVNFFPASYKHVLSVAATDSNDFKSSFSNYSCYVDVSAPGANIYSTWPGASYIYSNGTSMAAPIVAGAAGIVRSQFPSYTALQVLEQLKSTADNIYNINVLYTDYLGTGRINMFRSVTETSHPGIDMEDHKVTNNGTNMFASGDTLRIAVWLKNYLATSQNLNVSLRTTSTYVNIVDSASSMNSLSTFELDSNSVDPFLVVVKPNAPTNTTITFKVYINDGSYTVSYCFDIRVNADYINVMVNDIATSITSRGRIGYNDENSSEGLGFVYNDVNSMLYEGGLMLGNSGSRVSDPVRGEPQGQSDNDFASVQNVHQMIPSVISDFDLRGTMNDDSAGISTLNVRVTQNTYAWSTPGDTKYIILRYTIRNESNLPLLNLYAGIFADWDIENSALNRASFDPGNKMGYAYYTGNTPLHAGVKILTPGPAICYSIDNVAGGSGAIDITNGFSTSEKFSTLSTNRSNAGVSGNGNDIVQVVSSGPFTILPNDSVIVAFAMLAGDDLADLQNSAVNAQEKYLTAFPVGIKDEGDYELKVYPNPIIQDGQLMIPGVSGQITASITDELGKTIAIMEKQVDGNELTINLSGVSAGSYYLSLTGNGKIRTVKLIVLPE